MCNRGSQTPGDRLGIAVEMSGALTKFLPGQHGRNNRGLVYIGIKGCEMKRTRLQGEAPLFLSTSSPFRVALLAGFAGPNVKISTIPCLCVWGGGDVVTNDYCINKITQKPCFLSIKSKQ